MADRLVQLQDKDGNNVFPVTAANSPIITVTNTDPGTGSALPANNFVAVYGGSTGAIGTSDIQSAAITYEKVGAANFAVPVFIGWVAFTKRSYSNTELYLENLQQLYKATGVNAEIQSNTHLKFTLPSSGTYVAEIQSSLWVSSNTWDYFLMAIRKNGTGVSRAMGYKGGSWGFVNTTGLTEIENNDYLSTYLNTNGNTFNDGNVSAQDSKMLVKIYRVA